MDAEIGTSDINKGLSNFVGKKTYFLASFDFPRAVGLIPFK